MYNTLYTLPVRHGVGDLRRLPSIDADVEANVCAAPYRRRPVGSSEIIRCPQTQRACSPHQLRKQILLPHGLRLPGAQTAAGAGNGVRNFMTVFCFAALLPLCLDS